MNPPARYFPVRPEPLQMRPGLFRLGTDFGNAEADGCVFQRDSDHPQYRRQKAAVAERFPGCSRVQQGERSLWVVPRVLAWMRDRLAAEHPVACRAICALPELGAAATEESAAAHSLAALALDLQEDFVILGRDDAGTERAIAVDVRCPSGWCPETILGLGFDAIHHPVPEFDGVRRGSRALVDAIFSRGPYVRFVWTVCADDQLDHHPGHWERRSPDQTGRAYLRVERQLTVPLPELQACLFLIRTYHYAFEALAWPERETLATALRLMPASVRQYKGLGSLEGWLRRLDPGGERTEASL